MLHVSTTVKRLATAVLGAGLLLVGAPLMLAAPAQAGTASGPPVLSFFGGLEAQGQYTNVSTRYNQYTSTMRVTVVASPPGPGYTAITRVVFTQTDPNTGQQQTQQTTAVPFQAYLSFPTFTVGSRQQPATAVGDRGGL